MVDRYFRSVQYLIKHSQRLRLVAGNGNRIKASPPLGHSYAQEIRHPDVCSVLVLDYGLMLTHANLPLFYDSGKQEDISTVSLGIVGFVG